MMKSHRWIPLFLAVSLAGCHPKKDDKTGLLLFLWAQSQTGGFNWAAILPSGWQVPTVPADNPMSDAKVTLGRFLFYDKRLSGNQTQACASCHIQTYAFSDNRQTGVGSTGEGHARSPQHLSNAAYNTRYTWANDTVLTFEDQAKAPMYGTAPVELGLTDPSVGEPEMIPRLKGAIDVDYVAMFAAAFGGNGRDQITDLNVRRAIASFERTMISGNSHYDRYQRTRDTSVLTSAGLSAPSVLAGAVLFDDEAGDCFHCHGGFNFIDQDSHTPGAPTPYHANGVHPLTYYQTRIDSYGPSHGGLFGATGKAADKGLFRTPSLRNVAVTHPFMHDGSFYGNGTYLGIACAAAYNPAAPAAVSDDCRRQALARVVENYGKAGSSNPDGVFVAPGDLADLPNVAFTQAETQQLAEFLMSLTDPEFLTRESLSNPACGNSNFVSCP